MTPPFAINGRFLTQAMTGVQRFSGEVTLALDALAASGELAPAPRLLVPRGTAVPGYRALRIEQVGTHGGQAWEQHDLPGAVGDAFLLNLGNTAPLRLRRRQAVVIHDAGVFDTPESYSFAFRAWYRMLHRALPRLGTRLITVSEFSRGRLALRLGVARERIGVVPEGGEHILRESADAAALAQHGLEPGRYALVVGTGAAHKGLDALRGAASLLASRGMVLAVAGGADPAVFRSRFDGTGEAVRPLGRQSDAALRALYENALCLLFPSRYEGFGLPPLEAMWCGCPVIASRAGAVPEVCAEAALWFDVEAPEGLAARLAQMLDEPGLRDALVARGLERAAAYSWDRAARALLRLAGPDGMRPS